MTNALAYVLITTRHGTSKEVAQKLMPFEEVQNIHQLFGQYDLIAIVFTKNNQELSDFVNDKIIPISDIERTETLVISDIPKEG